MKRIQIKINENEFPESILSIIKEADVYDSSCSRAARVYFIDRDVGYYVKRSPSGTLAREAAMTSFFAEKGLAAKVLDYFTEGNADWMVTERVRGEDCTHSEYLSDPERLCDTLATLLRQLHDTDRSGCPVSDRMSGYFSKMQENYEREEYDLSYLMPSLSKMTAREAFKSDTLLHGDYCLPNVMLDSWQFSGFVDLDGAGIGDRHVDLYWGAWTLKFNLKTDKYRDRFFDAYGRDRVDLNMIDLVSAAEVFG